MLFDGFVLHIFPFSISWNVWIKWANLVPLGNEDDGWLLICFQGMWIDSQISFRHIFIYIIASAVLLLFSDSFQYRVMLAYYFFWVGYCIKSQEGIPIKIFDHFRKTAVFYDQWPTLGIKINICVLILIYLSPLQIIENFLLQIEKYILK